MEKIITTSRSNWVPKDMRVMKESWDWLVLTRGDTQLFMQGKLWQDLFTLIDSSLQGLAHWITIGRLNSQCQKHSWKVSRSIVLEASELMTTPAKLISEKHENLAPKKEDISTDTKESPQEVENQRSTISVQTGILRDKILGKETEISSDLFSDLGGTNIRSHIWRKSSQRAGATEYRKIWESWKRAETGWFWREATPNYSCKWNFGKTCLH